MEEVGKEVVRKMKKEKKLRDKGMASS